MLLIACLNVAILMLAHSVKRRSEIGIRLALGASRSRVVRQLVIESLLVGLSSVPLGLALTFLGNRLLLRASPPEHSNSVLLPVDWSVLLFVVIVAILTSLVFGAAPAFHSVRGSSCAPGFSWTLDCERVLAGGVSK